MQPSAWWTDWELSVTWQPRCWCDESCFMWCHCWWLRALGGVHRARPNMVTGESVCRRHGCLSLIQCCECHWLINLHKVWSEVQRHLQRCRDLPGFRGVLEDLFWEETTFTQVMSVIMTGSSFAQRAGPGWMVGSGVCTVWSSAANRFLTVTNSHSHNLGVICCTSS